MGALTVTKADLQFALSFMADPLPYRQLFFKNADTIVPIFLLLDEKATYAAITRTKNPGIEPSYFGESIMKFANLDFATGEGALFSHMTQEQEFDPTAREALKHFATHIFLNLAWWYIGPMLWAVRFQCPYMPESWVKKFLAQKTSLPLNQQMEYLGSIVDFIRNQTASVQLTQKLCWITPYEDISGQLGNKGRYVLRMLIGMFLAALDKPLGQEGLLPPGKGGAKDLDPSIVEFLESLNVEGFEGKK